ncbi:amidohydrolase [Dethiosulfatibacter aminovorans DSM 17477]|uniref:Amidohydrolase n=1 Tax=Dethiosulfatibacter aminovorans DSM 17477 TaxID=1121476 RepID=A0A1M6BRV1_9FIRM|nr:amidohydrolase [Dethiosulfatibacter aminovorans]SHI51469.1 amidohydrolase [Dethiosulfatibacter aminovorans DSM 17477]
MNIKELAKEYKDYAVSIRREFHMNPEPAMKEERTSDRIVEELEMLGIPCRKAAGTGVVGIIKGKTEGRTIALRADIDALELQEKNEIVYRSKVEGMMHGCGHDGHAASLLTAARILNEIKDEFSGTVKLLFQPGEEVAKGAKKLISEGELEGVDGIFGIHVWNGIDVGKVSVEEGPRMASAGIFNINITGKGGHGSMPNQGIDSVVVGAATVMNMQALVAREINPLDPAVVTLGIFNAGTRQNILAGEAYLEGTTRCFSMDVNNIFEEQIRRVAERTAESYRARAVLEYEQLVLPTINDPEMASIGEDAVRSLLGSEGLVKYEKTTGGEDFSFYTVEVPGAFAFVGSKNEEKVELFPHHHPCFDIDEDALEVASGLYAQYAVEFLGR